GAGTVAAIALAVVGLLLRGGNEKWEPAEPPPTPAVARPQEPIRARDLGPEFESLQAEVNAPLSQKNFKVARSVLEQAASRHSDPWWTQSVATLERNLEMKARNRLKELKDSAARAAERKSPNEVREARDEIAGWGPSFQNLLKEFEDASLTALASAPPDPEPPKPPLPEKAPAPVAPPPPDAGPVLVPDPERSAAGRNYLGLWQKAMGFASRRDFEAAAVELRAAARDFKEEDVQKEVAADLKDLARLERLWTELQKEMAALPSWTEVTLDVAREDGSLATVRGQVLQAGARRLELRGEPRFVEVEDISPGTLAKTYLKQKKELPPEDVRILGTLCALDGDEASMAEVLAGHSERLAPKFRNYCTSVQGKAPVAAAQPGPGEWAARKLFYQAEVEFRTLETREGALEKYDSLLGSHSSTSFVKTNRAEILARKEESKDYGFTALRLKGKSMFSIQKLQVSFAKEKVEMVGWKTRDEPAADDPNTYVEASFFALPETEYKAWALVGGCCATTFTWFLQASEFTYVDRKTRKTLHCDPGGSFAAPWDVKLAKLSTVHGGKTHAKADKEPTIWEWIEVPMPKYATGGVKSIRFMAASKGMAVAAVIVSAIRDKRPSFDDLKKFAALSVEEGVPTSSLRAGKGEPDLLVQIPEARPFLLVYDLDLAKVGLPVKYDVDHHADAARPFDRIAYLMELQKNGEPVHYVFVSMDAFTDDITKIGIPEVSNGARFQQKVSSMNVHSNVEGLATGIGLDGGNIEFWTNNYGPGNAAGVPGASEAVYDFGDQMTDPVDGYGSMQVHNYKAGQTIFALNHWRDGGGGADLGIGNSSGPNPDWTFTRSAGSYSFKRLRVLVRPKA
ncbi:MAG TPA: hypothetical protein VG457_14205, partial [Planctomycetota bacterium]|nr:hypothetical protein [Planctomycetota bacterium]